MYERLLITFAVMACAWVALSLLRRRQITQSNRASQRLNKVSDLPTIVYFWSDSCSMCKMTQRPILERILAEYGKERVAFTAYNIDEAPEVAKEWGVRTLPTTFVLDSSGIIRQINNGVVVSESLRKQLEPLIPNS